MKILLLNHQKSQCGVYEIGKRIHSLLDKSILDVKYFELPVYNNKTYIDLMELNQPDVVLYNYYNATLPYINKQLLKLFPKTKHIGIIHDPLSPDDINFYNYTFDAWIIHDDTNPIQSETKFTTIRPIRRYERTNDLNSGILNIGSHGFSVSPWKMFDHMIDIIHHEFDEVIINMNITQATFGGKDDSDIFNSWRNKITKKNVKLNITNDYFDTEKEVIDFLSKNDLNMYFYNPHSPYIGVAGSADLAISSQSSLVVNSAYMYRHIHKHLDYYENHNNLTYFLNNKNKVKDLYELWNPRKMTEDYKKMIETIL
jgi:hypothetical protein